MLSIDELKFDDKGLIPAVVTDHSTGEVLTLAYMNRESLAISMSEGRTCFWSRSRRELWRKGETSGNFQEIVSITADCDRDALLVAVRKAGPACHLGSESCFADKVYEPDAAPSEPFTLDVLRRVIDSRKSGDSKGSYTAYLFEKGLDKMLKKIGEESAEVIIAAKSDNRIETVREISDLVYHVLVTMSELGIENRDILDELASRHKGE